MTVCSICCSICCCAKVAPEAAGDLGPIWISAAGGGLGSRGELGGSAMAGGGVCVCVCVCVARGYEALLCAASLVDLGGFVVSDGFSRRFSLFCFPFLSRWL